MKAIVIESGELRLRDDVARPSPGPEQLLVRVRAAAVNHVDLMRKPSHFGPAAAGPAIAGLEYAGEVVECGAAVRGFAAGDRVMVMDGGAYAEYACVDHRLVARVCDAMAWTDAAATLVSFMTAHDALCTQARFAPGETVLLPGCTTGVGIAAAQIARELHAACVIGTSTTAAKLERMADFGVGVRVGVDRHAQGVQPALQDAVARATQGAGADVIVDAVGGAAAADNLAAAAIGARWVSVGRVDGKSAAIELNEFARKRLQLIGVTFRTRSLAERADVVARFVKGVLPAIAAGRLRPKVDSVYTLADARAAQDYVASGRHFGKVVLTVGDA